MKRNLTLAAGLVAIASFAIAEDLAPEAVAFDEYGSVAMSMTGVPGDAANGLATMENRGKGNCVACHVVSTSTADFQGNVGPSLDGAASRWDEAQLRGIVANAKHTFPDTVMPSFYKTSGYIRPGDAFTGKAGTEPLPTLLTAQEVEDVVAFLMTLQD